MVSNRTNYQGEKMDKNFKEMYSNITSDMKTDTISSDEANEVVAYITKSNKNNNKQGIADAVMSSDDVRVLKHVLRQVIKESLEKKLTMLIVGGSGVGKSSTINALFEHNGKALVQSGVKPVTSEIAQYDNENFTIYDSPGLGDSPQNDEKYIEMLQNLLNKTDKKGNALVDMIFIVIEANTRDWSSLYKFFERVINPLGWSEKDKQERILIGMNKCDEVGNRGQKEYYHNNGDLADKVKEELEESRSKVKERLKEATKSNDSFGLDFDVIYYAAGYYDEESKQKEPAYNLLKLLHFIINKTPQSKRYVYKKFRSTKQEEFERKEKNDGTNYQEEIEQIWWDTIVANTKEFIQYLDKKAGQGAQAIKRGAKHILNTSIKVGKYVCKKLL